MVFLNTLTQYALLIPSPNVSSQSILLTKNIQPFQKAVTCFERVIPDVLVIKPCPYFAPTESLTKPPVNFMKHTLLQRLYG